MRFIPPLAVAVPLAALLGACGTETVVEATLYAEPVMASRTARLELSIDGRHPGELWDPHLGGDAKVLTGSEITFPVTYRHTTSRDVEGLDYRINVRAYDLAGNRLTQLHVIGTYRPGKVHRHILRLDDACLFRVCLGSEQTCKAGRCVDGRDVTWDLDASTRPPPPPPLLDGGDAASRDAAMDARGGSPDASAEAGTRDAGPDAMAAMTP